MTITSAPGIDDHDLVDIDHYLAHGYPWATWDRLRADDPVHFHERPGFPPFWAVTRYDDVRQVHSQRETFINGGPILRIQSYERLAALDRFKQREAERHGWDPTQPLDMVYLDGDDHFDMRRLTMRSFTPAAMRRLEADLADLSHHFVEEFVARARAAGGEPIDLVSNLSVSVPLATICGLMDLPRDTWSQILAWTDLLAFPAVAALHTQPHETARDVRRRLGREFFDFRCDLIADRRARTEPGDDLASLLVDATVDGRPLSDQDLHNYLVLLINAGNETTRNAISGGVRAFLQHRDQIEWFAADPDGLADTAAEEVLRWVSPVMQFARTVTHDVTLGGRALHAGDTVVLFYPSANRDERQFPDPYRFDVGRTPNHHLAFGYGPHFCLGANLARWELRAVLRALAPHLRNLELAGEPTWQTDLHVFAASALPVRWVGP
jgi:cholest-4-en-3-one 26-monooxygenase